MFDNLIFPGVMLSKWQMMQWERIALTGLLSRLMPKGALEIGVYYGGSMSLTSQYAEQMIAIDIDPEVVGRFQCPPNVELRIGPSADLVPQALADFDSQSKALNFVLIDAEHTASGVRRDIELVLAYKPSEPMIIVIHDSGNPETRRGIISADWASNPHVHSVDCDFVPGQIIEHTVTATSAEVWGGLAIAYLDSERRSSDIEVFQSARSSIRCMHYFASRLSSISD